MQDDYIIKTVPLENVFEFTIKEPTEEELKEIASYDFTISKVFAVGNQTYYTFRRKYYYEL